MSAMLSGWSHATFHHPSAGSHAPSTYARRFLRAMLKAVLFVFLTLLALTGLTLLRFRLFGGAELVSSLAHAFGALWSAS